MAKPKYRPVLTRKLLAEYLSINADSISSGRARSVLDGLPDPIVAIGGSRFELRDANEVAAWAKTKPTSQAAAARPSRTVNPEVLKRAVKLPVGKTIVSNTELGEVFGVPSTAIAKRRSAGYMPAPVAEFEGARTPPAYDLDEVLEFNAGLSNALPVDEAVVTRLRETNTLPAA